MIESAEARLTAENEELRTALEDLKNAAEKWGDPNFDWQFKDAIEVAHTVLAERRKVDLPNYEDHIRDTRQRKVFAWAVRAFGGPNGENTGEVISLEQRALRFLEEACELYQAIVHQVADMETQNGGNYTIRYSALLARGTQCLKIMFAKPPGEPKQEIGGTMVTLLCLGEAAGISVCTAEKHEFERVLSKPASHWAARWKAKRDIGL